MSDLSELRESFQPFVRFSCMAPWNQFISWMPAWLQALALFIAITVAGLTLHTALLRWAAPKPLGWHPFVRHVLERTRRLVRYMIWCAT